VGLIPRSFIDDLINQTDIVSLIDTYIPLKKQGTSFVACCPFHQEKTPSFNVMTKKQFYYCFGCGASGNVLSFIMNYLNQEFAEAVETLAERLGLTVPREGGQQSTQHTSAHLYPLLKRVAQFYQKLLTTNGQEAQKYLQKRGVSGDVLEQYQIGYAPPGWQTLEYHSQFKSQQTALLTSGMLIQKERGGTYDRYRHRLMFPIHDRQGRIIGFGGRALDDSQKPKYLNSPETAIFHKNRELYGLHQVLQKHTNPNYILVVEGYMDVIALAQMGITQAVATLGTAINGYHLQLLAKYTTHVIFCFDGDSAGQQAAWRGLENVLSQLNTNLNASFMLLPEEHDPDSFIRSHGTETFLNQIQHAKPFHQFLFDKMLEKIDVTTFAGKNQLIHQVKPFINKIPDGPSKYLLLDELSKLTHLELHRIADLMQETTTQAMQTAPIKRTPIRVATALILQHPEIYASIAPLFPAAVFSAKQHQVLKQLMEAITKNPSLTTATLVEMFRDSALFEAVNKLATWDHQVPAHALHKEFADIVRFLAKNNQEEAITALINRSKEHNLTQEERHQLQFLLQQKKNLKDPAPG
jgi:DNA primase